MRIIIEIDETQKDGYQTYSVTPEENNVIIYNENQGLLIDAVYESIKEVVDKEVVKTIFVLVDINEIKHISLKNLKDMEC